MIKVGHMSDIDVNDYGGTLEYVDFGYDIPEDDFVRFVVLFIKTMLKSFNLEN